uniref:Mab-21 domain-containing protein n=1 Tax=Heterorhabditis bacteriophora TaxID=37862 RepID=A0A1I7WJF9_HETBA
MYLDFLQGIHSSTPIHGRIVFMVGNNSIDEDDPEDEEYNVLADLNVDVWDDTEKDRDELRCDKGTEIPLREVEGLFLDLIGTNTIPSELIPLPKKKRKLDPTLKKKNQRTRRRIEIDVEHSINQQDDFLTSAPTSPFIDESDGSCSLISGVPITFRPEEVEQLKIQLEQHVQLLTQAVVMCFHDRRLVAVKNMYQQMINDLDEKYLKYGAYSIFNILNLSASIDSCHDIMSVTPVQPDLVTWQRSMTLSGWMPRPEAALVLSRSRALRYPDLIPGVQPEPSENNHMYFTEGEDLLLALGLIQFRHVPHSTCHNPHGRFYQIHLHYVPCKTPHQIKNHMKVARSRDESGPGVNPMYRIIMQAEKGLCHIHFPLNSSNVQTEPMQSWSDHLKPTWYHKFIMNFTTLDSKTLVPIMRRPSQSSINFSNVLQTQQCLNVVFEVSWLVIINIVFKHFLRDYYATEILEDFVSAYFTTNESDVDMEIDVVGCNTPQPMSTSGTTLSDNNSTNNHAFTSASVLLPVLDLDLIIQKLDITVNTSNVTIDQVAKVNFSHSQLTNMNIAPKENSGSSYNIDEEQQNSNFVEFSDSDKELGSADLNELEEGEIMSEDNLMEDHSISEPRRSKRLRGMFLTTNGSPITHSLHSKQITGNFHNEKALKVKPSSSPIPRSKKDIIRFKMKVSEEKRRGLSFRNLPKKRERARRLETTLDECESKNICINARPEEIRDINNEHRWLDFLFKYSVYLPINNNYRHPSDQEYSNTSKENLNVNSTDNFDSIDPEESTNTLLENRRCKKSDLTPNVGSRKYDETLPITRTGSPVEENSLDNNEPRKRKRTRNEKERMGLEGMLDRGHRNELMCRLARKIADDIKQRMFMHQDAWHAVRRILASGIELEKVKKVDYFSLFLYFYLLKAYYHGARLRHVTSRSIIKTIGNMGENLSGEEFCGRLGNLLSNERPLWNYIKRWLPLAYDEKVSASDFEFIDLTRSLNADDDFHSECIDDIDAVLGTIPNKKGTKLYVSGGQLFSLRNGSYIPVTVLKEPKMKKKLMETTVAEEQTPLNWTKDDDLIILNTYNDTDGDISDVMRILAGKLPYSYKEIEGRLQFLLSFF